ncbi:MAG: N-acetylmuramoyl-L-alanine amidase [Erythrobacter sp.]|uniref:N-acetylmuramoyl-L-alanine amidase family protein n=1 Tax=Erythrobacter sp. TaxID=1042 RepID=UPI00263962C5|nr:N-acetylmuramoyl-L-alanine amidase [Erythrobacter sp.]MDJ0977837.1 N-acetylmuramoyl-L-alanine amidase [Erythrobacter sp.]
MSVRDLLVLLLAVPALVVGGALALGLTIPVPIWGRDYVQTYALNGERRDIDLPEIYGPDDPTRPLVVIDAGHGGRDPGAVRDGVQEKVVVLAIALRLRDLLLEQGGVRVALTREDDRIVRLGDRSEIARQLDANLFLSIHADSAGNRSDVSGASVYTLSNKASSEAAALFAARENNADRLNGVEIEDQDDTVSQLLVELSQERTQEDSTEFARLIRREGEGRIAFHSAALRKAALVVLRAPDVPAVLFESGFVTNREDRAKLTTEKGRNAYAEVLARSILVYFARRADFDDPATDAPDARETA